MQLEIKGLSVNVSHRNTSSLLLHDINLKAGAGEKIALIGPSGAGKTTLLESIGKLQSWNRNYHFEGEVLVNETDMLAQSEASLRNFRGKIMSYIFQEPMACFDPLMTIQKHFELAWQAFYNNRKPFDLPFFAQWLSKAGFDEEERILNSYPHQLSGGQLQRIMVVGALWHNPQIILADEPLSALDRKNQEIVLTMLDRQHTENGATIVMATHDTQIIRNWASRVVVLESGVITCDCRSDQLESWNQKNDFLISIQEAEAKKRLIKNQLSRHASDDNTLIQTDQISKTYPGYKNSGLRKGVLEDVNLEVKTLQNVGILGPSGSGKSTLARILLKLEDADNGKLYWNGIDVTPLRFDQIRDKRHFTQIVFQDTHLSLPPHQTIKTIFQDCAKRHEKPLDISVKWMEKLGLHTDLLDRRPSQLSGGQRQRLSLIRAIIPEPKVLILDEAINMLDPKHQNMVADVLAELQQQPGTTFIFISHDDSWIDIFCDKTIQL